MYHFGLTDPVRGIKKAVKTIRHIYTSNMIKFLPRIVGKKDILTVYRFFLSEIGISVSKLIRRLDIRKNSRRTTTQLRR